jgi:hypothetical protein
MKPVSQLVPGAIATLLRQGPLSPAKIDFAWKTAVGPAMARVTAVKLDGSVLWVEAETNAWAREVTRSSGVIASRLDRLLGKDVIRRIVVRN